MDSNNSSNNFSNLIPNLKQAFPSPTERLHLFRKIHEFFREKPRTPKVPHAPKPPKMGGISQG